MLVLCLYFPATSLSQGVDRDQRTIAPQDSVYKLSGGSTTLREVNGERVIELNGGVRIVHGDVVVTADRGEHYDERGITLLIGNVNIDQQQLHMESDEGEYFATEDKAILRNNVLIVDRGMTIRCDEATFYRGSEDAFLVGNVVVQDSTSTLTADRIVYNQLLQIAEAFGRVRITNPDEGIAVWGDHGYYYRLLGQGIIDENPRLLVDAEGEEPATVDADTMYFFPDSKRAVATGRVKIIKANMVTQCDSAVVVDSLKTATLYGDPLAKQDNMSMQAEEMVIVYDEEAVNEITLVGDAVITETPSDTLIVGRDNWMRGDSVIMYLQNNSMDSIRVVGNATSEYFPVNPGKIESNFVRGDRMFFLFENDSIARLEIDGNADGVYRFLNTDAEMTVDSLRAEADTSLKYVPFKENADKVTYSATHIRYIARSQDLELVDKGKIVYGNRTLLADSVTYNAEVQLMDASGDPILLDGAEKFYGNQMDYALDEEIGLVTGGSTKFMLGYYNGEEIAKVGDDVLKVWNSHYTTCDRLHPHYRFQAKEMKVYLDDKVVSGPIWLYVGDTPVIFLPFFAQNIRQGRRSGVLRPDFEFGIGSVRGRFIRNIGYYWATNQYTDVLFAFDFNENSSLAGRMFNRYKVRYKYDGNVNFRYIRDLIVSTDQWTADWRHQHTLGERASLNANLSFVSSEVARKAVSDLDDVVDIVDVQVRSTATYSKTWDAAGFTVSGVREQNLEVRNPLDERVRTNFPNVRLSIPSRNLYFGGEKVASRRGFFGRMFSNIRVSPNVDFNRTTIERPVRKEEVITSNQSLAFGAPTNISWLVVRPSFTLRNAYRYEENVSNPYAPDDTTFSPGNREVINESEFNWNAGLATNTNFYGTFYPEWGSFNALRHTMTPSVGYSYSPPRGSSPRSQRVNIGLANTIDVKIGEGEEVRKYAGVILWRLNTTYNPDAPERQQWSNIGSVLSARVAGANVSYNQSIDPYTFEVLNQSVSVSGLRLAGTHKLGVSVDDDDEEEDEEQLLNVIARQDTLDTREQADTERELPVDANGDGIDDDIQDTGLGALARGQGEDPNGLPWNLNLDFSYSQSAFGAATSTMNVNSGLNLTRNWRVTYSATYDLQNKILARQAFSIFRNLHCWEMSLNRRQLGDEWEFYFKITLVGHPELFIDQGNRGLGGPSGGGFGSFGF